MEDKILLDMNDVWKAKALFSLSQEEIMEILEDNKYLFSTSCPDLCEIERVLNLVVTDKLF